MSMTNCRSDDGKVQHFINLPQLLADHQCLHHKLSNRTVTASVTSFVTAATMQVKQHDCIER